METVWKSVKGHEGLYEVSNTGRVRNARTLYELKPKINKGYPIVNLLNRCKCKTVFVHRLVAIAFIDNPENKREVNHKDEDKTNNHVDNLQWATAKENSNWGTRNRRISETLSCGVNRGPHKGTYKRPHKTVVRIDPITDKVIKRYNSITDAMSEIGVVTGNISSCCNGKMKTYKGSRWMFYDDFVKLQGVS